MMLIVKKLDLRRRGLLLFNDNEMPASLWRSLQSKHGCFLARIDRFLSTCCIWFLLASSFETFKKKGRSVIWFLFNVRSRLKNYPSLAVTNVVHWIYTVRNSLLRRILGVCRNTFNFISCISGVSLIQLTVYDFFIKIDISSFKLSNLRVICLILR